MLDLLAIYEKKRYLVANQGMPNELPFIGDCRLMANKLCSFLESSSCDLSDTRQAYQFTNTEGCEIFCFFSMKQASPVQIFSWKSH